MKNFNHFFICDYSQTLRVYPENYWIASIKDNKLVFDSWDSAIKGRYKESDVLNFWESVNKCKEEHKKLNKEVNGRLAVIVKTDNYLGVQYWTDWQINSEYQKNTDNSISYFISKL